MAEVRGRGAGRENTYNLRVISTANGKVGALQGLQWGGARELVGQNLETREMCVPRLPCLCLGNSPKKSMGLTSASRMMWNLRYCTSLSVLDFLKRKSCCSWGSPRIAVSVGQNSVTGLWMGSLISPSRLFFCNMPKFYVYEINAPSKRILTLWGESWHNWDAVAMWAAWSPACQCHDFKKQSWVAQVELNDPEVFHLPTNNQSYCRPSFGLKVILGPNLSHVIWHGRMELGWKGKAGRGSAWHLPHVCWREPGGDWGCHIPCCESFGSTEHHPATDVVHPVCAFFVVVVACICLKPVPDGCWLLSTYLEQIAE